MKPLVSILIPAYNAENWIGETIQSAVDQSWPRKEIIVVDDGSRDGTVAVARRFASKEVQVVSQENQGAAAARNYALRLCQGDYIQWLDADDLLAPDKIEHQLRALGESGSKRILLSSAWAHFFHRTQKARFVPTSLWQDLSPTGWLLRKMDEHLHMQTATWLTSRELVEATGPWDTRLLSDDDGEYFCRVLLASEGTRFVPESRVFYRMTPSSRLSYIGSSDRKKEAMLLSMKLHVQYLRSLEDSDRVRRACLTYLQTWYLHFHEERPDLVAEMQTLASQVGGHLETPRLRWKYAWIKPLFGWRAAKQAQIVLPRLKAFLIMHWDYAMFRAQSRLHRRDLPPRSRPAEEILEHAGTRRTAGQIAPAVRSERRGTKALVSILIPAYNAEEWIGETIQSALDQTWPRKEIIIVDDGSRDRTAAVARRFASKEVQVVLQENQGVSAARNHALQLCQGDYIQWLDADDLLASDKIERQIAALHESDSKRILLSSPWGGFIYRHWRARFYPNSLWQDLAPVEWLLRKMGQNLHMQTATWLTSRELTEAAGPWDTRLLVDNDGEYFCRALLASEGTRFVPGAKVFYRDTPSSRVSFIGASERKKAARLLAMKLHIQYLRSLEESDRVREACLLYLQNYYLLFYPENPGIVAEMQNLAVRLGGQLEVPKLRWKYAWIRPIFGWQAAKRAQVTLPQLKAFLLRKWDKAMYRLESRHKSRGNQNNAGQS